MGDLTIEQLRSLVTDPRMGWATEKSINNLARALGQSGRINQVDTQGLQDQFNNTGDAANSLRKNVGLLGGTMGILSDAGETAATAWHKSQKVFSGSMATIGGMIGGFTAVIGENAEQLTQNYKQVISSGQTFNGNMLQLAIAAGNAGMSTDKFVKYIQEASQAAAQLGGEGLAKYHAELSATMGAVSNYGMSVADLEKHSAAYMDILQKTGKLQKMNAKQVAESFKGVVANADALAKATGRNRDEIIKEQMEKQKKSTWQFMLGAEDPQTQKTMMDLYSKLASKFGTEAADEMMSAQLETGNIMQSEFAQQMGAAGMGNSLNTISAEMQKASQGIEANYKAISDVADNDLANQTKESRLLLAQRNKIGGDAGAGKAIDALVHVQSNPTDSGKKYDDAKANQDTQFTEATKILVNVEQTFQKTGAIVNAGLTQAIDTFAGKVDSYVGTMNVGTDKILTTTNENLQKEILTMGGNAVKSMQESFGQLTNGEAFKGVIDQMSGLNVSMGGLGGTVKQVTDQLQGVEWGKVAAGIGAVAGLLAGIGGMAQAYQTGNLMDWAKGLLGIGAGVAAGAYALHKPDEVASDTVTRPENATVAAPSGQPMGTQSPSPNPVTRSMDQQPQTSPQNQQANTTNQEQMDKMLKTLEEISAAMRNADQNSREYNRLMRDLLNVQNDIKRLMH